MTEFDDGRRAQISRMNVEAYARLVAEAAYLRETIAGRELEVRELKDHRARFSAQQDAVLSPLRARLAEIESQILLRALEESGDDPEIRRQYAQWKRDTAEHERRAREAAAERMRPAPSDDLRATYRRVARLVHPDLAVDDIDRELRDRLMRDANAAFEQRDGTRLQQLLDMYGDMTRDNETVLDDLSSDRIEVLERIVAACRSRLDELGALIDELTSDMLYALMIKADQATDAGVDLLEGMAAVLRNQIDGALERLAGME